MTTGNLTTDNTQPIQGFKRSVGSSTWVADGVTWTGTWRRRSWSGGDSAPQTQQRQYSLREYSVVTKKGKVIKRHFKVPLNPAVKRKFTEPHPYSCTRTINSPGSGPEYYKNVVDGSQGWYKGKPWPYIGTSDGYASLPAPTIGADGAYRLLSRLQSSIKGADFDCGVFLGEGREALELISNSALRIGHAYRYLRKGDVVMAAKTLVPGGNRGRVVKVDKSKELSSQWLELEFGWKPLLSDMRSGAQFLAARLHNPVRRRYTASVYVSVDKTALKQIFAKSPSSGITINDIGVTARESIVAYIEESTPFQLQQIIDPATVAWELTPFSFVADWVMPIGDYLNYRSFFGGLKGSYITTNVKHVYARNPSFYGVEFVGSERSTHIVSRTISSSLNVPMPQVKPFGEVASWRRAVTSVALLTQIAKSSDFFIKKAT